MTDPNKDEKETKVATAAIDAEVTDTASVDADSAESEADQRFSFYHKQWWIKFEHNYDERMERYLWNEDVDPATFERTDFIVQTANDRDKMLDAIMYIGNQRSNATSQFLTLNSVLMSGYAYATSQTEILSDLLMAVTFLIISTSCCFIWMAKIRSALQFNTACFAAIRQYQRYLPTKPHGDALVKVLYESKKSLFRPIHEVESWLPKVFLAWYTLLFGFNLMRILT